MLLLLIVCSPCVCLVDPSCTHVVHRWYVLGASRTSSQSLPVSTGKWEAWEDGGVSQNRGPLAKTMVSFWFAFETTKKVSSKKKTRPAEKGHTEVQQCK